MMTLFKLDAIENQILECQSELRYLYADESAEKGVGGKMSTDLIISSGDISDVDGLFAVAQYAKTGADVLFVMNYPAYLSGTGSNLGPRGGPFSGLGYNYSTECFLSNSDTAIEGMIGKGQVSQEDHGRYREVVNSYNYPGVSQENNIKRALSDLAFAMINWVWDETVMPSGESKGSIYFCVGGINKVNPFHAAALKNEIFVYRKFMSSAACHRLGIDAEHTVRGPGRIHGGGTLEKLIGSYERIRVDFNGSMAFLSSKWKKCLEDAAKRGALKGAFVMGGVHSYEEPKTMPAIDGKLNRLSCATMNQLYDPEKTAEFNKLMLRLRVPVYIVSNNVVKPLDTFVTVDGKKLKTDQGWRNVSKSDW